MANIKLIRLLSGEEIVAEVVEEKKLLVSDDVDQSSDYAGGPLKLKNPFLVVLQPGPNDQVKVGMAPWMMLKKKDAALTIQSLAIVCVTDPGKEVADRYAQLNSVILQPDRNIVIPR